MFRGAKVLSTVAAQFRGIRAKYLFFPLVVHAVKQSQALRYIKPFALYCGSFVAIASAEQKKQTLPPKELKNILKKADDLFNENKCREALELLRPYKESGEEEIMWRISRAAFNLSKSKVLSETERAALIEESYEMAKASLELNEKSALAHKWMAVALDAYSKLQGFRSQCSTVTPVLNHMLRSIELDPNDATVVYMVGMWYFSIADLAWYQMKVLQAVGGSPPPASYEEALVYFKRAEDIAPNFYSLNLLMLGKCHLKLGDRETAIAYLQRAVNYPKFTDDDHQAHQEASQLLKKLQA